MNSKNLDLRVIQSQFIFVAMIVIKSIYLCSMTLKSLLNAASDSRKRPVTQYYRKLDLKIKKIMTKKPYTVEENTLATEVLKQMNKRKITSVCIFKKKNKKKIIGVIHIHNLIKTLK